LLAAYVAATGYPVRMNRQIEDWLRELCNAGFHADDVKAVIDGIRWHQKNGTRGYTEASVFVKNALDPLNFVCRATKAREKRDARARRTAALAAKAKATPAAPAAPNVDLEKFNAGMAELKAKLRGGGGR
jgi:hypothetical protein